MRSEGWSPEHDQGNWVDALVLEHGGTLKKKPLGQERMRANDYGEKRNAREKRYRDRKKREASDARTTQEGRSAARSRA